MCVDGIRFYLLNFEMKTIKRIKAAPFIFFFSLKKKLIFDAMSLLCNSNGHMLVEWTLEQGKQKRESEWIFIHFVKKEGLCLFRGIGSGSWILAGCAGVCACLSSIFHLSSHLLLANLMRVNRVVRHEPSFIIYFQNNERKKNASRGLISTILSK